MHYFNCNYFFVICILLPLSPAAVKPRTKVCPLRQSSGENPFARHLLTSRCLPFNFIRSTSSGRINVYAVIPMGHNLELLKFVFGARNLLCRGNFFHYAGCGKCGTRARDVKLKLCPAGARRGEEGARGRIQAAMWTRACDARSAWKKEETPFPGFASRFGRATERAIQLACS